MVSGWKTKAPSLEDYQKENKRIRGFLKDLSPSQHRKIEELINGRLGQSCFMEIVLEELGFTSIGFAQAEFAAELQEIWQSRKAVSGTTH